MANFFKDIVLNFNGTENDHWNDFEKAIDDALSNQTDIKLTGGPIGMALDFINMAEMCVEEGTEDHKRMSMYLEKAKYIIENYLEAQNDDINKVLKGEETDMYANSHTFSDL